MHIFSILKMFMGHKCYKFLVILRFILTCLPQTGYVHPDEHFQYPEIVYGDFLGIQHFKTWEFTCLEPIRSVVFPYLTIGIPAVVLNVITGIVEIGSTYYSNVLLILPRLVMCSFSLIHDLSLFKISKLMKVTDFQLLNIFASSYVTLVFFTRTLSNSLEAIFVTLIIYIVSKDLLKTDSKISNQDLSSKSKFYNGYLIGIFITAGCFIRPTFLLFAIAPVMFWVWSTYKHSVDTFTFVWQLTLILPGALITTTCFLIIDTVYYNDSPDILIESIGSLDILKKLVVTPLNFIRYNLDFEKVKTHGHHPRYLHILVNLHMLFPILGVWGLILSLKSFRFVFSHKSKNSYLEYMMLTSFILPIILLSVIPHQEPRFIIPILFPLICVCHKSIIYFYKNKLFFILWFMFNIVGTMFWGFLHQGGLTSAISLLHSEIIQHPEEKDLNIIFYHTYMPPRYLLAIPKSQSNIHIYDLHGSTDDVLLHTVQNTLNNTNHNSKLFLITPSTLHSSVVWINKFLHPTINFTLHNSFFPHLSTEDPFNYREIWEAFPTMNIKGMLSLHLYQG